MDKNGLFLEKYKTLEVALRTTRGPGASVLGYESEVPPGVDDKLKICRMTRNFFQHNPDALDFIQTTDDMCRFLDSLTVGLLVEAEKSKDCLYRETPLKTGMTLRQAFKLFHKTGMSWLPAVDAGGQVIGAITLKQMVRLAASATRDDITLDGLLRAKERQIAAEAVPVCEKLEGLSQSMDRGPGAIVTRGGRYSGVVRW